MERKKVKRLSNKTVRRYSNEQIGKHMKRMIRYYRIDHFLVDTDTCKIYKRTYCDAPFQIFTSFEFYFQYKEPVWVVSGIEFSRYQLLQTLEDLYLMVLKIENPNMGFDTERHRRLKGNLNADLVYWRNCPKVNPHKPSRDREYREQRDAIISN